MKFSCFLDKASFLQKYFIPQRGDINHLPVCVLSLRQGVNHTHENKWNMTWDEKKKTFGLMWNSGRLQESACVLFWELKQTTWV